MPNLSTLIPARFRRLRHKATAYLACVILACTGVSAAMYAKLAATTVRENAAYRVREVAHTLAVAAAAAPLARADHTAMLAIAEQLIPERDVCYVAFADPAGRVLAGAQQGEGHLGTLLYADGISIPVAPLDAPAEVAAGTIRRLDVTFPVFPLDGPRQIDRDRVVGYVRIGLSLAEADRTIAALSGRVSAIALLIVLLVIPLSFALMKHLTAPLGDLCNASRDLAAGRLDRRVDADRVDEIGDLASAFNGMAGDLSHSRDELMKLNGELEDRVLARTFQLSELNRQLRQEMAEKDDFLRTVSHDLNALLRNVAGMIGLLRQSSATPLDDQSAALLDRINHNVAHELELIDELLALSQIRSRREVRQRIDLDTEVRAIIAGLDFELTRKNIDVSIIGTLPKVWAEKLRMRQLFQNLIDNSIKYTDPAAFKDGERPTLTLEVAERSDAYDFRLADRGIGIDPRDRDRVFYIFRRAKNGFVAKTPGKGVGLANCKGIVQNYGGRIWIEDNPAGGSVFCFSLAKVRLSRTTIDAEPVESAEPSTPVEVNA